MRKRRRIQRRLGPYIHRPRTTLPRPMHKVSRRIHRPRSPHHHHQRRLRNLPLNPIHLQRNLAKEHNMRPHPRPARAASHGAQALVHHVIRHRRFAALVPAARFGQFPMHVYQPLASRPLMQVVHILCTKKEALAQFMFELRQCDVRRVRLSLCAVRTPLRIKLPHQPRIALPCFRRANILNAVPRPQSIRSAKRRQPALGADAGAGEHKDMIGGADRDCSHGPFLSFQRSARYCACLHWLYDEPSPGRGNKLIADN